MSESPSYQKILLELAKNKVRYLVAGGIAMNLHGLSRSTIDLDLIIFLERENILRFIQVMNKLGYKPRVPVKAEDFADEGLRKKWIKEKNMVVFSFHKHENLMDIVDVFVNHPRPFEEMFEAGKIVNLSGKKIHIVGLKDMLFLKKKARRPKDDFDIRFLEAMLRKQQED